MPYASYIKLALLQGGAILGFYILYHTQNPKPYTNMIYFILLGALSLLLMRQEGIDFHWWFGHPVWAIGVGVVVMGVIFGATRAGYELAQAQIIPYRLQTRSWLEFIEPWRKVNWIISGAGIFLVVVALELFYRNYTLELLLRSCGLGWALILSSVFSMLRSVTCGLVAGGYDLGLSLVWGLIYLKAGLIAALVTHLVWDILFVYLAP